MRRSHVYGRDGRESARRRWKENNTAFPADTNDTNEFGAKLNKKRPIPTKGSDECLNSNELIIFVIAEYERKLLKAHL
jgi:hypothetical protein